VYRTRDAVVGALIWSASTLGLVVLAVVPGRAQVGGYVGAPLFALCAWRAWQMGAHVDDGGVKVVGFLFSRHVAWADIERFAVMPAGRYPYVGHIMRFHGPPVIVMAISTSRGKTEKHRLEAQQPIDELNGLLAQWQCGHE
jgi:hypothetical protein